jgi:hypothetical protein
VRTFGLILIGVGIALYYVSNQRLAEEGPVPPGLSIEESLEYPAARYEIGEYAGAMLGGLGVLLMMFPKGR